MYFISILVVQTDGQTGGQTQRLKLRQNEPLFSIVKKSHNKLYLNFFLEACGTLAR